MGKSKNQTQTVQTNQHFNDSRCCGSKDTMDWKHHTSLIIIILTHTERQDSSWVSLRTTSGHLEIILINQIIDCIMLFIYGLFSHSDNSRSVGNNFKGSVRHWRRTHRRRAETDRTSLCFKATYGSGFWLGLRPYSRCGANIWRQHLELSLGDKS